MDPSDDEIDTKRCRESSVLPMRAVVYYLGPMPCFPLPLCSTTQPAQLSDSDDADITGSRNKERMRKSGGGRGEETWYISASMQKYLTKRSGGSITCGALCGSAHVESQYAASECVLRSYSGLYVHQDCSSRNVPFLGTPPRSGLLRDRMQPLRWSRAILVP